jgi:HlyD family secretion protein
MKKQLIAGLLLVLTLGTVIAYRVHAQNAYKHAPSGGSATLEGTEAVVAAKVGGRLVEVLVQEGDRVKAGQVVARLDCEDQQATLVIAEARVKQAEAQVAVAEKGVVNAKAAAQAVAAQVAVASARQTSVDIQHKHAERDLDRAATLNKNGVTTPVDLDRAETAQNGLEAEAKAASANVAAANLSARAQASGVGTADAQVTLARAGLEAATAEQGRAKLAVAECALKAPHDGTVVARLHEPGAVLAPGARVLTLIDLTTIKATFFLPNAELARARPAAKAEVKVDTYPTRVFTGTVTRVASEAEFTPRNVQTREDRDRLVYGVEVSIPNPDAKLRSGMPVEVTIDGTGK